MDVHRLRNLHRPYVLRAKARSQTFHEFGAHLAGGADDEHLSFTRRSGSEGAVGHAFAADADRAKAYG